MVPFCTNFSECKCRKHEKCDKNGKCKCKKGYIKKQGKCVRVKGLCLTYYSWTSTNGHLSILQGPHFWGTVHNWHLFPPLYNGHLFTAATLLSSIPKVAVKESFNCNCNITSENTVHLLYTLFRFLKGLHFSSFSHPSHKNHQGSFHLSPSLVNINFFLAPSKIKGDAYSTKPSGHVTLLASVLLGGLALTAWIWRLLLLSLLMFCELRWNFFPLSVDLFLTFPISITHMYTG